ncbi:MAG: DUF3095 family protein [Opitutales bacterium]|nr:DUF3095 family protein [Opitutales bacterium]MCH8539211.1 DUF3095 domain-containing protein [Opitutales bacterium]
MENPLDFYASLPAREQSLETFDPETLVRLPDSWGVGLTDVLGSTQALEAGRYKEVNLVGAATIMAVLNQGGFSRIPYLFGGDGALFAFPWEQKKAFSQALEMTQAMAAQEFGLNLRAGVVRSSAITEAGGVLQLGKTLLSPSVAQAVFWGNGWEMAEEALKERLEIEGFERLTASGKGRSSFVGLECRWHQVPSRREEILVLIARARGSNEKEKTQVYRQVMKDVERIYGSAEESHPIDPALMRLSLSSNDLQGEWRIRSYAHGGMFRFGYWLLVRLATLVGIFLMRFGFRVAGANWAQYKAVAAAQSDARKFDNQLRQVLAGKASQREELVEKLNQLRQEGKLIYGVHASSSAYMTCLISDYHTHHVHLVDGTEGGYAMAAKEMKNQMKEI